MKEKNHKAEKNEHSKKEVRRKINRTPILTVDFLRIEDEAITDFEKDVAQRLAKAPSPQDILIDEERMAVLLKVLPKVPLTPKERLVVEMTLEGLEPVDINRKLGVDVRDTMVTKALARGKKKLIRFLRAADYFKYQKD